MAPVCHGGVDKYDLFHEAAAADRPFVFAAASVVERPLYPLPPARRLLVSLPRRRLPPLLLLYTDGA